MSISETTFRQAMTRMPSPVTIVTTRDSDDNPAGATIGATISLSLEPQLVMVSVITASAMAKNLRERGEFILNVLSDAQEELALRFGSSSQAKFNGTQWSEWEGLPRIDRAVVHLACMVRHEIEVGDHTLFAGEPFAGTVEEGGLALAYADRTLGAVMRSGIAPHGDAARAA